MKPSEFDWAGFLDELKRENTLKFSIRDGLWLLDTIVGTVPKESYNETFDYIEEELDKITVDTFMKNKVDVDYTPLMDAHAFYHKMFRQIDVFSEYSHISDTRFIPIDMLFYNFINSQDDAHWYFFKKAVFRYVGERDDVDTEWL